MECLFWFSSMINGTPKGFFLASRGPRESFFSSSFFLLLFLLGGETSSKMLAATMFADLLRGFQLTKDASMVSHLQFTDNTLIFCDVEDEQVKNIIAILLCFEDVSWLKIIYFFQE